MRLPIGTRLLCMLWERPAGIAWKNLWERLQPRQTSPRKLLTLKTVPTFPRKHLGGSLVIVHYWASGRTKAVNRCRLDVKRGLFLLQCGAHCVFGMGGAVSRAVPTTDSWMGTIFSTGLTVEKRISTTSSCYAGAIITWYTRVDSPVRKRMVVRSFSRISDKRRCRNGPSCQRSVKTTSMSG